MAPRPKRKPGPDERTCSKCGSIKPLTDFALKVKGQTTGADRIGKCSACAPPRVSKQAVVDDPDADSGKQPTPIQDPLPASDLDDVLDLLSEDTGVLDLEVCVRVDEIVARIGRGNRRAIGDALAKLIWDKTHYRFRYHAFRDYAGGTATRFKYHCAQNADRAHKPEKHADPEKQRDKISLDVFDCSGWMYITVSDLTLSEGPSTVLLKLSHTEDHVHYQTIHLPTDVQDLIRDCGSLTVGQIWKQVLEKYPEPLFTRKAVYNAWAQRDAAKWKRDDDQLKSAEILLEEGKDAKGLGMYRTERIPVQEPGFEALAWSLPDALVRWGGRLREVALDSAWETNGSRFELFALLGEGYGSGLPLGFLLMRNVSGAPGGTQSCLEQFIDYFAQKLVRLQFSHSDKCLPEINAFRAKVQEAKHQLCFWHSLRAVKVRLSILRRQPAYYNIALAHAEFSWISEDFLPTAQRATDAPPIIPVTRRVPTITVRMNGKLVPRPLPRFLIRIPARTSSDLTSNGGATAEHPSAEGDNNNNLVSSDDEAEPQAAQADDMDPSFAAQLDRALKDTEEERDEEDGPDWLFEEGEARSRDPDYVFCPAQHRQQLLRIFTRHFVQHPDLPEPDQPEGSVRTALEIRTRAVREMYDFCFARGLAEVWAYMWTSWYSAKMWQLWALSAATRIPRLRTTMTVENFWKQLKHDWLHHLTRPRLDQLVWIICTELVPVYMHRASKLENVHRLGRSKALNSFQIYLKREWKKLARVPLTSGRSYRTNIATWQCNCGAQKYSAHLLCKHLVQAVPKPSPKFWTRIYRRRTVPFYRDPELRRIGEPLREFADPDEDPLTDGDDQVWLGNPDDLRGGGRWREMLEGRAGEELHLKRKRSETPSTWRDDLSSYSESYDAGEINDMDAEQVVDEDFEMRERVRKRARNLRLVADAIDAHLAHASPDDVRLWLSQMAGNAALDGVDALAEDIDTKEQGRTRRTTWARNRGKDERRLAKNTMGYQVGLIDE